MGELNGEGICFRPGSWFLAAGLTLDCKPHEIAPVTYRHPSSITGILESALVSRRSLLLVFLMGFLSESLGKPKTALDKLARRKSHTCTI